MTDHPDLSPVLAWVGRSYAAMTCWDLVREAFALRGVALPNDYYKAASQFRVVDPAEDPEPWDVIVLRTHPIITNHIGLMLGSTMFIHSLEGVGVTIGRTDRVPWQKPGRIAGVMRLRASALPAPSATSPSMPSPNGIR